MKIFVAIGAAFILGGVAAFLAGPDPLDELRGNDADLAARARVSLDQARATALALSPGGRILEEELEDEGGTLMYSFEIEVTPAADVMEVDIDAMTGEALSVERDKVDDREGASDAESHGGADVARP